MGFYYDDVHSKEMGINARITSWQVCGALRNSTAVIPGKYGIADFGADFDSRKIKISCSISPKGNLKNLITTLDKISAWLDASNGLKQLILDDAPDRYFMARLNEKCDCERLLIRSAGSFELNFLCPDPFGYAISDEHFNISAVGTHTVKRKKGNIFSNPVYRIKGVLSAGTSVTITTKGSALKIVNAVLSADEVLIIDSEKMTAWVENNSGLTLRNALPYLQDLNFPSLDVGNNEVKITADGGTFTSLEIIAKSRWR